MVKCYWTSVRGDHAIDLRSRSKCSIHPIAFGSTAHTHHHGNTGLQRRYRRRRESIWHRTSQREKATLNGNCEEDGCRKSAKREEGSVAVAILTTGETPV